MTLTLPRHSTVVAYLALFVALGGSAYAVTTSPATAPIRACYAKRNGTLRILSRGRCRAGEKLLVWNRQGPPGTVDTNNFYTRTQSDARYLPIGGTATNANQLGGQPPSAFAPSSLFGGPGPASSNGSADSNCFVSEVKLMAGVFAPPNWHLADGSLLPISANAALFSVLGTDYGGDGKTTFALPDLRSAAPKGNSPTGVNYYICTSGIFP